MDYYKSPCLLACDASSVEIGYSIFDLDTKKLLTMNHLSLDKGATLIEKVLEYEKLLIKLLTQYNIVSFCIEQSMMGFFGGGSSASTIEVLTSVNFGYRLLTHKLGVKVNTITVSTSRKNTFPGVKIRTLAKLKKIKEKEYCFNLAIEVGEVKVFLTTKTVSRGKNKGLVVYNDWCKDMVDSWIVGVGFLKEIK